MPKVQPPFETGVTVKVFVELAGEIIAIPLHEFFAPVDAVVAVKLPLNPVSVAANVCAFALPVAVKSRVLGESSIGFGEGLGVGVAVGVGEGVGVAVGLGDGLGVGDGVGEAVGLALGRGVGLAVAVGEGLGRTVGLATGVGLGVGVGAGGATLLPDPPDPLQAATAPAAARTPHRARTRTARVPCDDERSGMTRPHVREGESLSIARARAVAYVGKPNHSLPEARARDAKFGRTAMISPAIVCPELVGRNDELEALFEYRRAAARGHGSLVLLSGEAGIGKSRLLTAFRETLTHGRAASATGQCREFGSSPYGAVVEALRGLGCGTPSVEVASRAARLTALQRLLEASASRRNSVLIVEDLQWADQGTLEFLIHLLPALGAMRALVIATYRSEDVDPAHAVAPFLARLTRDRGSRTIALEPLTPAETRRLVRLALPAPGLLSSERIEEIVERSDGNPFFAEELSKSALERRATRRFHDALPLTIRAAVVERLADLDEGARAIVRLAAVIGRRFEAELLAAVAERPLYDVFAVLRRLRELSVIDELPGMPSAYVFRHALTREAIAAELLAGELRPLHAAILRALETGGASAHDLGYHAAEALDVERSVRYNELAGDEADAQHAHGDAVRCYDRALRCGAGPGAEGRLLAKAAASSARNGQAPRAADLYEAAVAAYRRAGETARVAELYLAMSSEARHSGDKGRAMDVLRRALRTLPDDGSPSRAMMTASLAIMHLDHGEQDEASRLLASSTGAAETPVYRSAHAYAAVVAGNVAAMREESARSIALCAPLGPESWLRARFNLGFCLCVLGIDEEALTELESLLPELHAHRLPSLEVLACANAALIHARAGRPAAGRALVLRALEIPEPSTTGPIALAAAALTVGLPLRDDALIQRSVSPALVEAAFASRMNSPLGRLAGPYARWLVARDQRDTADVVLRRALEALAVPFGATETLIAAAEFGAPATTRGIERFVPALEAMSATPLYAATLGHLRAIAFHRRGEPGAAAAFLAAAERYRALGWVVHEARCLELGGGRRAAASVGRSLEQRTARVDHGLPGDGARVALSEREREIASLVARGTPNRRLAERFAVSQRTIEKHLTSIYGKLGLRNRSELAAFVARREV